MLPATSQAVKPKRCNDFDAAEHGYGALVERDAAGLPTYVTIGGMDADPFTRLARANCRNSWGSLPIGRVDPQRPDAPPHKTPWLRGYHGRDAVLATDAEIESWPRAIAGRVAFGGERGILNLGARMPVIVVGLDVDQYGPKHGLDTIAEHEARLGPLPLTYVSTARRYDTGSGIRLYRVPPDWEGPGMLAGGHVDLIQRHLRFMAAPGSYHNTGRRYRLYDQRTGERVRSVLPQPGELPMLPESWLAGLYRKPRVRGALATSDDVRQFAENCTFDEQPRALGRTVRDVRDATGETETRPATHRALWIAARKARAGCYPWERAVAEIERAARDVYAERGKPLDEHDFGRSVEHAVTAALDLAPDELARWGPPTVDVSGWWAQEQNGTDR